MNKIEKTCPVYRKNPLVEVSIRLQDPRKDSKIHLEIAFLYCVFPVVPFLHIGTLLRPYHVLDIESPRTFFLRLLWEFNKYKVISKLT